MSTEFPTIDMETFNEFYSILEDDTSGIIEDFINDVSEQLPILNEAITESDFKHIYSLTHRQIGPAGNLGLSQLSNFCEKICAAANEENIVMCKELTSSLTESYEACKIALTEQLKIINQ